MNEDIVGLVAAHEKLLEQFRAIEDIAAKHNEVVHYCGVGSRWDKARM